MSALPPGGGQRSGRSLLVRGIAVLVLAFALGYLVVALMFLPGSGRDTIVTVPDLRGRSLAAARRSVSRAGLELERGAALTHPTVPAGAVLAQSPLPGREVARSAAVRVILSAGRDRRPVPDVAALGAAQARLLLARTGFRVEVSEVPSEQPVGRVVEVEPAPGSVLELPATVRLVLSSGPPLVAVPSVVSLPEPAARSALRDAGLRVGDVSYDAESSEPLGGVASQQPQPGDSLRAGGAVNIVLSGSPPAPVVPLGVPRDSIPRLAPPNAATPPLPGKPQDGL